MDGHPSVRPTRELSEPPAAARRPPCAPLFGLAPARACPFHSGPSLATRPASSLWRWSSPRGGRVLPASLLCGARTFLERGLSTDASAAVQPPPGTDSLLDSNRCSELLAECGRRLAGAMEAALDRNDLPRAGVVPHIESEVDAAQPMLATHGGAGEPDHGSARVRAGNAD